MNLQAQQHYLNTQVLTASPGELTFLLYNGCLKFMKQAQIAIDNRDVAMKHQSLVRAQNILDELQSTLNMDYEISSNLFQLYDFIKHRLTEANIKRSRELIDECISLVTELRDTWAEALKSLKSSVQVSS